VDYQAIDLAPFVNADDDIEVPGVEGWRRDHGAFEDTGFRQTEVVEAGRWGVWVGAGGWRYYLWSWVNPRPEHDLVRIEIEAREAVVEVGGLCLGFADEHPLQPEPARAVVAVAPADYRGDGSDLALEVDLNAGFRLPDAGGTVAVEATAASIFPMFRLELVHSGRVIASSESESGAHELRINENVTIDKPGWICVRVDGGDPEHLTQHRDVWRRAIMAHTSPVYVACGAQEHRSTRPTARHWNTSGHSSTAPGPTWRVAQLSPPAPMSCITTAETIANTSSGPSIKPRLHPRHSSKARRC
jgi:hypothetical protein